MRRLLLIGLVLVLAGCSFSRDNPLDPLNPDYDGVNIPSADYPWEDLLETTGFPDGACSAAIDWATVAVTCSESRVNGKIRLASPAFAPGSGFSLSGSILVRSADAPFSVRIGAGDGGSAKAEIEYALGASDAAWSAIYLRHDDYGDHAERSDATNAADRFDPAAHPVHFSIRHDGSGEFVVSIWSAGVTNTFLRDATLPSPALCRVSIECVADPASETTGLSYDVSISGLTLEVTP